MILRNDLERKWTIGPFLWALPMLLLAFIFPWSGSDRAGTTEAVGSAGASVIFDCDLEEFDDQSFRANGFRFDGLNYRTKKVARSGRHSLRLAADEPFGLTTVFVPADYSASYHLTVWRYNPDKVDSWLVAASNDAEKFYLSNKGESTFESDDWERLHLIFQIPEEVDSLKIYCYAAGSGEGVYFDDMRFEITDLSEIADTFEIPQLDLQVSEDSYRKIKKKRDEAWKRGLLVTQEDDWVAANLSAEDKLYKSKIRLKGDWLDHLRGTKWSFRVKVKDPHAFWGMKTFNLQRPETRGFLREWLYHKWLDRHDIATPTYKFVLLRFNNRVLGFYALEEHFEKELVEARRRREGPIIKFNEERFWAGMQRQFDAMGKGKFPLANNKEDGFWAADIQPFKESALVDNLDLRKQFDRAHQLLAQYKYQKGDPASIFDSETLGKYLAIVEITGAYHSLTWHNQRWYYNPLSDRLEPIGFDGFTEMAPALQAGSTILPDEVFRQEKELFEPYRQFFTSEPILAAYTKYLWRFSDSLYLPSFSDSLRLRAETYEQLFREEYFNYRMDWGAQEDRIARIRLSLTPYASYSIIAQRVPQSDEIFISNTHHLPLKIVGFKSPKGKYVELVDQPLVLPNAKSGETSSVAIPVEAKAIFFQQPGLDSMFSTSISSFDLAQLGGKVASTGLTHQLCRLVGDEIILKSGQTSEPIIIPSGYRVIIPSGLALDFTGGAYFLSDSPITAVGSEADPILIQSSDGSGALAVRNAKETSQVSHVIFEGLGRINEDGYLLTGGVTFYNTSVRIENSTFTGNHQEDALNLVRSEFSLQHCIFSNTAFDAFDADFCTGSVRHCTFKNTGNDAMDFSGSTVEIHDCWMSQIGDKGISVGENSQVSASDISIEGATIGVASKDLSKLDVANLTMKEVGTGFTAFQKKPTFGPAEIRAKNVIEEKVKHLHIIEVGSLLTLDGLPIIAN